FSLDGETAYIIFADQTDMLAEFKDWLDFVRPTIYLHYAVHDAGVLRKMGINLWDYNVVDTGLLSYALQDLPPGLKDLGKRLLCEPMEEYEDVVRPWQEKAEQEWRAAAYEEALDATTFLQQFTSKGKPRKSKGQFVYKRAGDEPQLGLVLHVERGQKLSLPEEGWAELHVGPKPGLDLSLVPDEIGVPYAGRDAYVTRRIGPALLERVRAEELGAVADLDHAVQPMIEDMEQAGLTLDVARYWEVTGQISARREEVLALIRNLVGDKEFNPGSSDQVEKFCHANKLELTKPTKSRLRYSTD